MSSSITTINTDRHDVYAFLVTGKVNDDDLTAMAETMNAAFSQHDSVNMLLVFDGYEGTAVDATFNWEAIKAQFASLANVSRYAVTGAPKHARNMIEMFQSVLPVEAKTFDEGEISQAWAYVGAHPA